MKVMDRSRGPALVLVLLFASCGAVVPSLGQFRDAQRQKDRAAADRAEKEAEDRREARLLAAGRWDGDCNTFWPGVPPHFVRGVGQEDALANIDASLKAVVAEVVDNSSEAALNTQINDSAKLLKKASCINVSRSEEWEKQIEPWRQGRIKALAEERRCQATPACAAQRILPELCGSLIRRDEVREEIADQKRAAKRHGVMIISSDLAEFIEEDRDLESRIRDFSLDYKTMMKKPFSRKLCRAFE